RRGPSAGAAVGARAPRSSLSPDKHATPGPRTPFADGQFVRNDHQARAPHSSVQGDRIHGGRLHFHSNHPAVGELPSFPLGFSIWRIRRPHPSLRETESVTFARGANRVNERPMG